MRLPFWVLQVKHLCNVYFPWWDTSSYPLGWLQSKTQIIINRGEDAEKLEPLCVAGGHVKQYGTASVENSLAVLQVKHWITKWPSNSTGGYLPQRIEDRYSNKNSHRNVHSSTVHNSQKQEMTQIKCPLKDEWTKSVVYTFGGIPFNQKKEWSINICNNMDEPWQYYAKWKKPDTKRHILWFHLYEVSRTGKSIETESRLVVAKGWGKEE